MSTSVNGEPGGGSSRVRLALWAACILAAGSLAGEESRECKRPPLLVSCSPGNVEDWKALRALPLGIAAWDYAHPALRPTATDKSCDGWVDFSREQDGRADDGVHAWVLAAPCKHTACGRLESFESNLRTPWLSGEFDLNNNILVEKEPWRSAGSKETRQILEDHACDKVAPQDKGYQTGSNLSYGAPEVSDLCFERPPGNAWTLHVEITPPSRLRGPLTALWYKEGAWQEWKSALVDEMLCVHGPFVADTGHEAKPEIHPAQLLWWKETLGGSVGEHVPGGDYGLFLIQDASSRYNKAHNFVIAQDVPEASQWRPWAQGPVRGQFDIPFGVKPDENEVILRLESYFPQLAPRDLSPLQCPLWVDEEKHQAPRPAQVEWVFPKQAGPDVSSQPPVCVCDKDWCGSDRGSVFGVLRVDGSVGEGREWEEGFLAMRLLDSRSVQPQLEANLRWEPHRYLAGPAWEVVTVGTDQRRAMVDAVEPGLPPPPELGSVLVLREAKVTTVGVVSQLALPETRAVHLTTRWTSLKLCTGEACNDLRPKASGENQILLSLPGGSESLRHVVVEAEVDAHGLPRGVALSKKIVAQHFWTHAFGARKGEVESWKQAWRDWIREAFGDRASRQVVAERAETALADQILTLTELSEIYELCGEEGHVTTQ